MTNIFLVFQPLLRPPRYPQNNPRGSWS